MGQIVLLKHKDHPDGDWFNLDYAEKLREQGWYGFPSGTFKDEKEESKPENDSEDKDALFAQAEELGVKVDRRWSMKRLLQELQEAK